MVYGDLLQKRLERKMFMRKSLISWGYKEHSHYFYCIHTVSLFSSASGSPSPSLSVCLLGSTRIVDLRLSIRVKRL